MTAIRWLFAAALLAFAACGPNGPPQGECLVVSVPNAQLWSAPSGRSEVSQVLAKGTAVFFLYEVSAETYTMVLEGKSQEGCWIKVSTPQRDSGWIFSGAVAWDRASCPQLERALAESRPRRFLGTEFFDRAHRIKNQLSSARSDHELAGSFLSARQFRSDLETLLAEKLRKEPPGDRPDWFWLNDHLPGMLLQSDEKKNGFRVFFDYRPWLEAAKKTEGTEDDLAMESLVSAFPQDSTESDLPGWRFFDPEQGFFSMLGRGRHLAMLRRVDEGLRQENSFRPVYNELLRAVLDDLINARAFWESPERLLVEYEDILAGDFVFWTPEQKLTLTVRRGQLKEWKKNGLVVNGFDGGNR